MAGRISRAQWGWQRQEGPGGHARVLRGSVAGRVSRAQCGWQSQ